MNAFICHGKNFELDLVSDGQPLILTKRLAWSDLVIEVKWRIKFQEIRILSKPEIVREKCQNKIFNIRLGLLFSGKKNPVNSS